MWQPTNKLEEERLNKAQALKERGVELYPRRATRTHTTAEAIAAFEALESENPEAAAELEVTVAGRVRRVNVKGKVSFMHYADEQGRLQLFLRINDMDENQYMLVKDKLIEIDDFVQATGTMMRTRAGEISVRVSDFQLLSKTMSPLPVIKEVTQDDGTVKEYGEFSDKEARYRQRYADLAVNKDVRDVFRKRAKTIRAMQNFLDDEGMLEVETPILQPIYGGAAARPFTTHHNQLHQDLFLRISFELYLKRLLVGGYDAVYEIGRDFRNEGVSWKHNPEFTMLEFYKAYIDYTGVMDITERMTAYVAEQVTGSTKIIWQDHEIDLTPPWERLTIREAGKKYAGVDYMDTPDAESMAVMLEEKFGEKVAPGESWGRMVVERLLGNQIEPHLIQPTIIMDYPRDMSPFAKPTEYDVKHTERFEYFIGGMEMGNAFTELNDPFDQEQRFVDMATLYGKGKDEETPFDEDYLRAMRYGMPPMGGYGGGVDRLVMLLTNQRSIRDVVMFPHLRSRDTVESESDSSEV
ncbi:MAG: lysine--tRNA ligase [Anaerolineae bacterium]|nr:lysine--tRNA ligase [Anaerolineae bacterium]MDQ7033740.1 lysine--tRNA ligase [Anaerolineae bacterium]